MTSFSSTPLTKINRSPQRGAYDKDSVYTILDAGFVCQAGFVDHGVPVVIPMSYGRKDDALYLHGASTSRIITLLAGGNAVCINVTFIDGIVVARSLFDTSVNYRSVVIFGNAEILADELKLEALRTISDHILPGRWEEVRQPLAKELKATTILRVAIDQASAKIRTGPPDDDVRDLDEPVWAGTIPLRMEAQTAIDDPALRKTIPPPKSVLDKIKSVNSKIIL